MLHILFRVSAALCLMVLSEHCVYGGDQGWAITLPNKNSSELLHLLFRAVSQEIIVIAHA